MIYIKSARQNYTNTFNSLMNSISYLASRALVYLSKAHEVGVDKKIDQNVLVNISFFFLIVRILEVVLKLRCNVPSSR